MRAAIALVRPAEELTSIEPVRGGQPPRLVEASGQIDALREGADAVLPPDADAALIRLAGEAAAAGLAVMPRATLRLLMDTLDGSLEGRRPADGPELTVREREVLRHVAEGASNKEIARRLGISAHTVKFHVASILDKLDSTGRVDAVAQAARLGLILL